MSPQVDIQRRDGAISVLSGPTTVVDIAGYRIVMDFSENADDFVAAFDQAGITSVLRVAADGDWIDVNFS